MADAEMKFKSADDFKMTITLYSGRQVTIDLMQITDKEWRSLFSKDTKDEDENALLSKVAGLTSEEIQQLKLPELKQITETLLELGMQPTKANPT